MATMQTAVYAIWTDREMAEFMADGFLAMDEDASRRFRSLLRDDNPEGRDE